MSCRNCQITKILGILNKEGYSFYECSICEEICADKSNKLCNGVIIVIKQKKYKYVCNQCIKMFQT